MVTVASRYGDSHHAQVTKHCAGTHKHTALCPGPSSWTRLVTLVHQQTVLYTLLRARYEHCLITVLAFSWCQVFYKLNIAKE